MKKRSSFRLIGLTWEKKGHHVSLVRMEEQAINPTPKSLVNFQYILMTLCTLKIRKKKKKEAISRCRFSCDSDPILFC